MRDAWPGSLTVLGLLASAVGCSGGDGGQEAAGEAPAAAVVSAASIEVVAVSAPDRPIQFNRDIRPILTDKCFACHGPDAETVEAGLRLDSFEGATDELSPGVFAVVPGDVEASELWVRVNDTRYPMPPEEVHKPLSDTDRRLLRRWIEAGAEYQPHWAYVAPVDVPVPAVSAADWPMSDIDRFILHRLEDEGLAPMEDADKATLLRRVTYDLTGLPPTLEALDAFLADHSDDAFERVVDRLLDDKHFGERLAVFWLDLVRYADTVGYHGDQTHNVSPYRDWVIWAFNENMPFDTFTVHQLAGDMIDGADENSIIASCYNRLLQTSHEGGVQFKEYVAIYHADRVRNVSEAWMGATVGCAQCHDHKYDPYSAHDFYAMSAFFADIDDVDHIRNPFQGGFNALPTRRDPERDVLSPLDRERMAVLQSQIEAAANDAEKQALQTQHDAITPRRVLISNSAEPREVRLLPRGNWLDETGPVVEPAVPAFMGELDVEGRATRLDLARWLISREQDGGVGEMTARVFMNRLWAQFYGRGLCPSLEDFGGQGEPPNHPELLDHLALAFVDSGWDIKQMVKLIVMTRTYQLSSVPTAELARIDPMNDLYARQSRKRLPAEMIRDTALSVSGLLVDQLGGASVNPYQPAGYYAHLNFPQRRYAIHADTRQWRRGVYVHWQRQFLHPMLKAFDAPTREECTAERPVSNTPLAALNLLNDPTFIEASRAFAQRVLTEAGVDNEVGPGADARRLAWAMRTATARAPSAREVTVLLDLLSAARDYYGANPAEAGKLLGVGIAPRDTSLDAAEHAAWAEVARAILNLHETITRG
ncbi:PSD1 and planctomycete cytochrome C domain-containing protein [Phycisphaeraceae bacterium D3-23]